MFVDAYVGTVTVFAGTFAPAGWLFCQGQQLSVNDYTTLYSVIGTTYGGDGVNNFSLPNLQSRVAIGAGQATGMQFYTLGQTGGSEAVTAGTAQLAMHNHPVATFTSSGPGASSQSGTTDMPTGNVPAQIANAPSNYNTGGGGQSLGQFTVNGTTGIAGNGAAQPIPVLSPYLAMNYIICVEGLYPPHS